MAAEHVAGGKNLERAAAVATTNLFAVHLKLSRKVGVDGHELLGQAEVVAGLLLVIGEQIAVTAANGEAVERGEHKVGRLPILLGPAAHYEVVERRAVGAPRVEGAGEQVPAVGLHGVEERPAGAPAHPGGELRGGDDTSSPAR